MPQCASLSFTNDTPKSANDGLCRPLPVRGVPYRQHDTSRWCGPKRTKSLIVMSARRLARDLYVIRQSLVSMARPLLASGCT